MKKFLIAMSIFSVCVVASIFFVFSLADGASDPYYLRLSSSSKINLVLGTSKAAQGIHPKVLSEQLRRDFYNYSFSLNISPYGDTYSESIFRKLDTTHYDQVFLLAVDVWSLCSKTKAENNADSLRENATILNDVKEVNRSPNYRYLIKHFKSNYYKILTGESAAFLHDDGWLEIKLNLQDEEIDRRRKFTMNTYKKNAEEFHFSEHRNESLTSLIAKLTKHGRVYLVKLPIHEDLQDIENDLCIDFEQKLAQPIALSDGFYDMTPFNTQFIYTDGVHLSSESGAKATRMIGEWIREQ